MVAFSAGNARAQELPPATTVPEEVTEPVPRENFGETGEGSIGSEARDAAAESEPGPPTEEEAPPAREVKPPEQDYVEWVHGYLSRQVLTTAEWLDSFFDDPRFAAEDNRTRLKVGVEYLWDRAGQDDFSVPISARLRLPKFEEKARIVLLGTPERDVEGQTPAPATAASNLPGAQDNDVTAAVDYFAWATKDLNIAARAGVRFRDGEPEVFVQPRYRQLWNFMPMTLRFVQDFKWWTEYGWESVTTFDLERAIDDKLFFRSSLQGAWTEREEETYYYSLSFNFRQILSPRRVVQYELVNGFQTQTQNDLDEIRATVRFRQKISGDWLFWEFAPYASFRKDQDFDFTPGFLLRFEMFFGRLEGLGV